MKKLITMTDFVLQLHSQKNYETAGIGGLENWVYAELTYAQLLQTPRELGMFIPCNSDGEPMEKPKGFDEWTDKPYTKQLHQEWIKLVQDYYKALDSVLFEGWDVDIREFGTTISMNDIFISIRDGYWELDGNEVKTIEDLIKIGLQVTDTKAKELGL